MRQRSPARTAVLTSDLWAPPLAAALRAVLEFEFLSRIIASKQSMAGWRCASATLTSVWPRTDFIVAWGQRGDSGRAESASRLRQAA